MGYRVFQKLCEDRGITPYKVAQDLGFSRGTFTDWKMGRSTPKMAKMAKVAEYFDCPVERFYADDETIDFENAVKKSKEEEWKSKIVEWESPGTDYYVYDPQIKEYYSDENTAEKAQKAFDDVNMKILFDACRNMSEEQIKNLVAYATFLKTHHEYEGDIDV